MKYLISVLLLVFAVTVEAAPRGDAIDAYHAASAKQIAAQSAFSYADCTYQSSTTNREQALELYDNEPEGPDLDAAEQLWNNGESKRSEAGTMMVNANSNKNAADQHMAQGGEYFNAGDQYLADGYPALADWFYNESKTEYNLAVDKHGGAEIEYGAAEIRYYQSSGYYLDIMELLGE